MQGMTLPLSEMSLRLFYSFYVQAAFLLCITLLPVNILTMATTTTATIATTATSTLGGNETDRLALLAFKSKIIHDPLRVMSSWNDSLHFCEWQGVNCSRRHKRVTVLNLQSRRLVGSLSPYLGNLSFLREIMLFNNSLQGEIPGEVGRLFRLQTLGLSNNSLEGKIPSNLSGCSNLKNLALAYNFIVGELPMELGSLSKLTRLIIHRNTLTGRIPPSVGNLTSLRIISANINGLEGSIPDTLGRLKSLQFLGLGRNKLSGMIPPSIYNLSLISTFALPDNQLHGSLPQDMGLTLPHLQRLAVWKNQFAGNIPFSFSNASKLEDVMMSRSHFTGEVSVFGGLQHLRRLNLGINNLGRGKTNGMNFLSSLANCSSLEVLDIRSNQFQGVLPNSVANLSTQLRLLVLGDNQLSGAIPSVIGNLVNLIALGMENNRFTSIPTDIGNLQNLQRLALAFNRLSGNIPSSLGKLSLLYELRLQRNQLQGTIPSSLGNCKKLVLLDLSQNNLSGTIPKQLIGVSALSISLKLAQNHLVGSLPSNVGSLENLMELDVSENELSGEIPSSMGRCISLENLQMEGNFFQGSIPPSLSSLRGLQNFDLSRNNLSGQIPSFLGNFSLKNLNLSFNDFKGEVPMKGVFTNASAISVVGNKKLCGGVPELQLSRCTIKESKRTKMSFVLILIISIVCALVGVSAVASLLFCWLKKKRKDQSLGSLLRESFLKVSYGRLLKATDGFSLTNLIGVGSFGSVYKGILVWDETVVVAVKVLNLQRRGASKSFMAECEALRNIRHRNLVKIITSCSSVDFQGNDFKALVYEFMPNGSLDRWLRPVPETNVDRDELQNLNLLQRINIAIDVACALDYLHHHCQKPIVHCDLKPSNILLDSDMTAHVGDFGLAKFLSNFINPNQSSSVGIRGTIGYAAPEYGLGSEVSTSGDVYSYGILLLEMMTGKRPTDRMFGEGLNLHNFARLAFPDQVMEIVEPTLLNDNQRARQERNGNRMVECLISLVKIGIACSMESPQDRMDISNVVHEIHLLRDIFQGNGIWRNMNIEGHEVKASSKAELARQ